MIAFLNKLCCIHGNSTPASGILFYKLINNSRLIYFSEVISFFFLFSPIDVQYIELLPV